MHLFLSSAPSVTVPAVLCVLFHNIKPFSYCWSRLSVSIIIIFPNHVVSLEIELHRVMFHYPGENPRGFWQLKLIDNPLNEIGDRVLNGFGTLHLDTSKQDTDVEDLEEQVIDDQTKQQQTHVQQLKLQVLLQVSHNALKPIRNLNLDATVCMFSRALCQQLVFAR